MDLWVPRQPDKLRLPRESTARPGCSSAAAQALPAAPVKSSTQIVVLMVVSTLCYKTNDLLEK